MTLKGNYSDLRSYSSGDVVRWTDSTIYVALKNAPAGIPPTDTRYWERAKQEYQDLIDLILDAFDSGNAMSEKVANNLTTTTAGKILDARQGKVLKTLIDDLVIPDNVNESALILNSSTASSTKKFAITVDDDGELTATEVVDAGSGGEG